MFKNFVVIFMFSLFSIALPINAFEWTVFGGLSGGLKICLERKP
jgi:hypothetical protein